VRHTQISELKAGPCIRMELKLSKISNLPFYVLKNLSCIGMDYTMYLYKIY